MYPVLFHLGSLLIPSYGVVTSLGVLLALGLAQFTSRHSALEPETAPRHAWNMLVLAVFASLAVSRLVLIAINLGDLKQHPQWLLALAMVHHPLLAGIGILAAAAAIVGYSFWAKLSLLAVADCLAAPACLGVAFEQAAALLAGSDYGRLYLHAGAWAVTYTSPFAERWSGTPLEIPLYPVQAYAAAGALLLTTLLLAGMRRLRRPGDVAGTALIGIGILLFVTENFRDWEGRGTLFGGVIDIPQLVAVSLVLLGGLILAEWRTAKSSSQSERSAHV